MAGTNLTLSLAPELLRRARKVAIDRDTSVNELVRRYLEALTAEADPRSTAIASIRDLYDRSEARLGNHKWTRDELHERGPGKPA